MKSAAAKMEYHVMLTAFSLPSVDDLAIGTEGELAVKGSVESTAARAGAGHCS